MLVSQILLTWGVKYKLVKSVSNTYQSKNEAVHQNNSVSSEAAGWLKKVRLETFFYPFFQKCFFKKNGQYFPTKKKKKI